MFCSRCGKELSPNSRFCKCCGAQVEKEENDLQNTEDNYCNLALMKGDDKSNNSSKRKSSKYIIIIVFLLLFVGIICIVFRLSQNTLDKNTVGEWGRVSGKGDTKLTGNMEMRDSDGNVLITIEDIDSVSIQADEWDGEQKYHVKAFFTHDGTKKFEDITNELFLAGEGLEIYIDDIMVGCPIVLQPITSGEAIIVTTDSYEDAEFWANKVCGYESE